MFGRFVRHVRQQYAGFLALFIALGGVSYAAVTLPKNSIGSKQIGPGAVKASELGKNAVNTAKVKDGSLLPQDFAAGAITGSSTTPGPQGPQGERGEKGEKGDPGTNGSNGTNGATNVTVRRSTQTLPATCTYVSHMGTYSCRTTEGGEILQAAECAPGERAVSGGYDSDVNGVVTSRPDPTSGTPTRWVVGFPQQFWGSYENQTSRSFNIWAVCVAP